MMEEYDEAEAVSCAEEDWEMDRQGKDALDRTMFCDSIFQLAGVPHFALSVAAGLM